ncbi:MAG: VOC family protein [Candidatus Acidiferrum sp.]|jgi:PhnB protein
MSSKVQPIPEGYRSVSPAITCRNAASAIDFYKKVLGATVFTRMDGPGGLIMHAELQIGDSRIFISDEFPGMSEAPRSETPVSAKGFGIFVYTEDVDSTLERAIAAGARVDMPVQDMFWGDRYGKFTDPFGHSWGVATHTEDVAPEEVQRRSEAFSRQMAQSAGA